MARSRTKGLGGGAARRLERTSNQIEFEKYIERKIPTYEYLNDEALEIIEANAEIVLEEIGVRFQTIRERLNCGGRLVQMSKVILLRYPKAWQNYCVHPHQKVSSR
tara:strand:- start:445 stop:762 length:318 start_codon:yes stop_codon:yes gene_type:complete